MRKVIIASLLGFSVIALNFAGAQGGTIGGGGANNIAVRDTVKNVTFDSVSTVRLRADTVRSQAGASKRLVLQTTTSGSTLATALRFNELQQSLHADGSSLIPTIGFSSDTTLGLYKVSSTAIGVDIGGTTPFFISTGGSNPLLRGGTAGTFAIRAGGAANRGILLGSVDNAGLDVTFASSGGDTLKFGGHAIAAGFTTASGTPGTLCYNTSTFELLLDNATTCAVSARRFKHDIALLLLADAKRIVMGLKPATFTYNSGGRKSIGLIAEEADSVDARLGFRNKDSTLNSVDYLALGPILVRVVQDQQHQIDSLKVLFKTAKPTKADVMLTPEVLALFVGIGAVAAVGAFVQHKAA